MMNVLQVSVLDAAAMGEVLETFIVSSTPVECITAIPAFDENDPDVLTSQFMIPIYVYTWQEAGALWLMKSESLVIHMYICAKYPMFAF